jgi:hypothetical protein
MEGQPRLLPVTSLHVLTVAIVNQFGVHHMLEQSTIFPPGCSPNKISGHKITEITRTVGKSAEERNYIVIKSDTAISFGRTNLKNCHYGPAANQLQIVGFLNCKDIASDRNFTMSSLLTSFSLFASRCRT